MLTSLQVEGLLPTVIHHTLRFLSQGDDGAVTAIKNAELHVRLLLY